MRTCLSLKGSITRDELGTFMGSLVITTSYNVTFSKSDLHEILIMNSFANLMGLIFGQICKNIVTHIYHGVCDFGNKTMMEMITLDDGDDYAYIRMQMCNTKALVVLSFVLLMSFNDLGIKFLKPTLLNKLFNVELGCYNML